MPPPKKIPIVQIPAYDAGAEVEVRPIVRVSALAPEAQAQYQRVDQPIEQPIDEMDEGSEDESDVEPQPVSTLQIRLKPLDETKRAEYTTAVDRDAQAKRLRAEKEDPDYISQSKPVQTIVLTRSQKERIAREEADKAAAQATLAECLRRFDHLCFPNEMRQKVLCHLATKAGPDAAYFIDAIYGFKKWKEYWIPMFKSIETTEIVLKGPQHEEQFRVLHPAVLKKAKVLKIVYIGTRTNTTQEARNDRLAEIARLTAYNKQGHRSRIPPRLPMFTTSETPAQCSPMYQMHALSTPLYINILRFQSLHELVLDFRSLITLHHNNPKLDRDGKIIWFDYFYLTLNAIQTACGIDRGAISPLHRDPRPQIKKLTLLLPPSEFAREPKPEDNFPAGNWINELHLFQGQNQYDEHAKLLNQAPSWGLLEVAFTWKVDAHWGWRRVEVPDLTRMDWDRQKGEVRYTVKDYKD